MQTKYYCVKTYSPTGTNLYKFYNFKTSAWLYNFDIDCLTNLKARTEFIINENRGAFLRDYLLIELEDQL